VEFPLYRTNARVKGGKLYQAQTESHLIVVGTPGWFDWLEQHRAFLFVDRACSFTAYKSDTDPDGEIWEAARTHHGQRSHILLGRSRELSLERLQAAAKAFAARDLTGEVRAAPATSKRRKYKHTTSVGSPTSLLQTKLYRPAAGDDVIPRARLMQRLTAALEGRATLVSATLQPGSLSMSRITSSPSL
jgi:LuxR family transcriptional regulator, maltose regulon positive regulatory protein